MSASITQHSSTDMKMNNRLVKGLMKKGERTGAGGVGGALERSRKRKVEDDGGRGGAGPCFHVIEKSRQTNQTCRTLGEKSRRKSGKFSKVQTSQLFDKTRAPSTASMDTSLESILPGLTSSLESEDGCDSPRVEGPGHSLPVVGVK